MVALLIVSWLGSSLERKPSDPRLSQSHEQGLLCRETPALSHNRAFESTPHAPAPVAKKHPLSCQNQQRRAEGQSLGSPAPPKSGGEKTTLPPTPPLPCMAPCVETTNSSLASIPQQWLLWSCHTLRCLKTASQGPSTPRDQLLPN